VTIVYHRAYVKAVPHGQQCQAVWRCPNSHHSF